MGLCDKLNFPLWLSRSGIFVFPANSVASQNNVNNTRHTDIMYASKSFIWSVHSDNSKNL